MSETPAPTPKKRGRRPGSKVRTLSTRPNDPHRVVSFHLYESEVEILRKLGAGTASAGLVKLLNCARIIFGIRVED